jgi:hypothetical protein
VSAVVGYFTTLEGKITRVDDAATGTVNGVVAQCGVFLDRECAIVE